MFFLAFSSDPLSFLLSINTVNRINVTGVLTIQGYMTSVSISGANIHSLNINLDKGSLKVSSSTYGAASSVSISDGDFDGAFNVCFLLFFLISSLAHPSCVSGPFSAEQRQPQLNEHGRSNMSLCWVRYRTCFCFVFFFVSVHYDQRDLIWCQLHRYSRQLLPTVLALFLRSRERWQRHAV
jgi:hypothetical protein